MVWARACNSETSLKDSTGSDSTLRIMLDILDKRIKLAGRLIMRAWPSLWARRMQFRVLFKGQPDRVKGLQHRIVQFSSNATAVVKQGAQSLLRCLETGDEAASNLFSQ